MELCYPTLVFRLESLIAQDGQRRGDFRHHEIRRRFWQSKDFSSGEISLFLTANEIGQSKWRFMGYFDLLFPRTVARVIMKQLVRLRRMSDLKRGVAYLNLI